VGDAADALAARVVDPDLRPDVALRVDVDPRDVPALAQQLVHVCGIVEALVVERHDQPRCLECRE